MAKIRTGCELRINGNPYAVEGQPSYSHGGISKEIVQDSRGNEAGYKEVVVLPSIECSVILTEDNSLSALSAELDVPCTAELYWFSTKTSFVLADAKSETPPVESDGMVPLTFRGGTPADS